MGNCMSASGEESEQRRRSNKIDKELEEDSRKLRKECKILLLGSGESGKSTIVKQMKIIHLKGYSQEELASYRPTVYKNLLECAKALCSAMREFEIDPVLDENKVYCDFLLDYSLDANPQARIDPRVGMAVQSVWNDPAKERLMERQTEFYLMDSAEYFFQEADRIVSPNYLPTEMDVLRARTKTTGIYETRFKMGQLSIHMFDVGGQRSERKKWIHCFENVTSIIFCVALSEYDQVLLEESSQNRMMESLLLFDSVVNSRWFIRTSIILFLNKVDIFKQKLGRSPLGSYFPDYSGGSDVNKAAKYLLWRFNQVNRAHLNLYPHLTQATDTSNIRLVFAAVKETILNNALKDSAPIVDIQGSVVPEGISRPKHRRTFTGFGAGEIKHVEASIPEPQREAWLKHQTGGFKDKDGFEREVVRHVETTLARSLYNCDESAAYSACALAFRDRLILEWNRTQQRQTFADSKRVYYLSLEFLMGRALDNAMLNVGQKDLAKAGLAELGFRIEDVIQQEHDAALGNGGLGRLAACFLDSLASLNYPAWGYGLRYRYGIFKQEIIDGYQVEVPDYWLDFNPWEFPRHDVTVDIQFYGHVVKSTDASGKTVCRWEGGETVKAVAYDVPIPGYATPTTNNLRLWSSKAASGEFDFQKFNSGDYESSVADQQRAETISAVLYPNDNLDRGKELRLKQQYFWVAASLYDIVRRFKKSKRPWKEFPDQVAIQLNDTHPTLAIVELQRILVDLEGLEWDEAWNIVVNTFGYTNHTVLPEALEKWSVPLIQHLLPRHLQIIYDINLFFLQSVERKFPNDRELLRDVSIIEESQPKMVRMAFLAIVGSHKVNGVAELHSDLIKSTIFKDFVRIFGPDKFTNVTNGITPRRWLHQANPRLSELIASKTGGNDFLKDLTLLNKLEEYVDDKEFRKEWAEIKYANKVRLAKHIKATTGVTVNPSSLFDVQVKRIHEYKRQQMNIFGVIHRYLTLKSLSPEERQKYLPRVSIFGGKAAPGYWMAKQIIHLINAVGAVVNNDKEIGDLLKVIFLEDYNVSKAEMIIPASDISEHISTAGTEASGTSNMKFVLNGGLIIGTCDGANIEITREIGENNIFLFGNLAEDVEDLRHARRYGPHPIDPDLARVFEEIEKGTFGNPQDFAGMISAVREHGDYYLVSDDFHSYIETHALVDEAYRNQEEWITKCILSVSRMGFFTSDRCINEYAEGIWNIEPLTIDKTAADGSHQA
ncbi:carbohydrate phosphorylase-domain-containing protein [Achaetomium macrosporum]|uniref:Alpha-1,4 glucan phosphorylase n=1 Tax=Achaetomium macrosporum TaxID=79813 RepID=A0AAN7CEZ4_9PEZI|nr:carbohydrate phosphorylase-domain-containing protein [Achaetomium macrosporum]